MCVETRGLGRKGTQIFDRIKFFSNHPQSGNKIRIQRLAKSWGRNGTGAGKNSYFDSHLHRENLYCERLLGGKKLKRH